MNDVKELVEELRNKKSRDNRDLLDRSADMIERLAKELCEKSGCHHKCHDTKDCVVEDEAKLMVSDKEKQIEEMAFTLGDACAGVPHKVCETTPCNHCRAEALYNAGYRKQSEGKWKLCSAFDDFLKCSCCGYDRPWQTAIEHKFCPNCGAKMKGGEG